MAQWLNKDPKKCQCSTSPIYHDDTCRYGGFHVTKKDIEYDFSFEPEQTTHQSVHPISVDHCNECREDSRKRHDHTASIDWTRTPNASAVEDGRSRPKKFHGLIRVSEEVILQALGIYDENVQIRNVMTPFGKTCIELHLTGPDRDVDTGDGNTIRLEHVSEGQEIPYVVGHLDGEQEENIAERPAACFPS